MEDFIIILVTTGSAVEAERLARTLVEERLAACVNRIKSVKSIYRWQGNVEESEEELLIIKSRKELFANVEKRVAELHSYSVPEVIALPIIKGSQAYLHWLGEQLSCGAA
jgi:periplasmic divalent cation tolerance protein